MSTIHIDLIKELRTQTGVSIGECKKALIEANGNMEQALEILKKRWLAKAASKIDRETSEGLLYCERRENTVYMVGIQCETDFLAKSERFFAMTKKVCSFLQEQKSKEEAEHMIAEEYALEMGENIKIKYYEIVTGDTLGVYIHNNGKIGAIVKGWPGADENILKKIAMHIVAMKPLYLSVNDIPEEVREKEIRIQKEILLNDEKMKWKEETVIHKIVEWKIKKWEEEVVLFEQPFVFDDTVKIKDLIKGTNIQAFSLFTLA